MSNGCVYAVREPGARDVKIGKTRQSPEARRSQLNSTGVLRTLESEFVLLVSNPDAVEKPVHRMLEGSRVRRDREFFRCSPRKARSVIKRATAQVGSQHGMMNCVRRSMVALYRSLRVLVGSSLAFVGLALIALLLFVIFVDPLARDTYAPQMLVLFVVSGMIMTAGVRMLRK